MKENEEITPWDVKVDELAHGKIDYDRIITKFGCKSLCKSQIEELEKKTKMPVHPLLKRGFVFAHRDFDRILSSINSNFYLYTGRGPSSENMHLGHAIPFILTKYLQDAFDVPLVIQMTDDEKFLWKNQTLDETRKYTRENIKDIIAFGFNPKKTYIFSNIQSSHLFAENTLRIGRSISYHEVKKVFGFDDNYSISQIEFPAKQIAPCFPNSFSYLSIINDDMMCLVPAAIDQDPYFRLARDKSSQVKMKKPCTLYSKFLPDLEGHNGKMSASVANSSIYLSDNEKTVFNKIKKHAFSGGGETLELHRRDGANLEIDVAYKYLTYFLEDDQELMKITEEYGSGKMLTGSVKKRCAEVLNDFLIKYQARRKDVTDADVEEFMKVK